MTPRSPRPERRALQLWTEASAAERDRLLSLPAGAGRLAALDAEEARQLLTPEHRAEVLDSIARLADAQRVKADTEAAEAAARARWAGPARFTAWAAEKAGRWPRFPALAGWQGYALAGLAAAAACGTLAAERRGWDELATYGLGAALLARGVTMLGRDTASAARCSAAAGGPPGARPSAPGCGTCGVPDGKGISWARTGARTYLTLRGAHASLLAQDRIAARESAS